jgi:hypothetical protein
LLIIKLIEQAKPYFESLLIIPLRSVPIADTLIPIIARAKVYSVAKVVAILIMQIATLQG